MTDKKKSSHAPLIAILVGTAMIVIAACGGVVYLIHSGVSGMTQMIEARRGPTEVVDDDYRVRVSLPTDDADPTWEVWGPELSRGWSPDGIVVLRNETCAAGLTVVPRSDTVSLETQLRGQYGDVPMTPHTPPRGATSALMPPDADDGSRTIAFEHAGTLFEIVGREPCPSTLVTSLELLPGPSRPRWVIAPIENTTGRSFRVTDRVFESAASGLRVDATEPFSLVLDDLVRSHSAAEVVVRHRNGAVIRLDPFRRGSARDETPIPADARSLTTTLLGSPLVLGASDPTLTFWDGRVTQGDTVVVVSIAAPDRARAERALADIAPRVTLIDAPALLALRAAMPPPADRRAGLGWSFRDGVFREHQLARPTVVLTVPPFVELLAGVELLGREHDAVDGRIVAMDRRDLGVSMRLSVQPTASVDAREALESAIAYDGPPVTRERLEGDATLARAELVLDPASPGARRMTVFVRVEGGWAFTLEAWRGIEQHPDTGAFLEALSTGLSIAPAAPPALSAGPHLEDPRLGFSLDGAGAGVQELASEAPAEASSLASNTLGPLQSTTVIAVSDPLAESTTGVALDLVGIDRSVAAIWARPPQPTTLDGRPATMRVLGDMGFETRVIETRIDRTSYLVVLRGGGGTDWQSALGRVDLDP